MVAAVVLNAPRYSDTPRAASDHALSDPQYDQRIRAPRFKRVTPCEKRRFAGHTSVIGLPVIGSVLPKLAPDDVYATPLQLSLDPSGEAASDRQTA